MNPAVTLFTGIEPDARPVNKIVTLDNAGRLVKSRAKSTAYIAETVSLSGIADLRDFLAAEVIDRHDRMVSLSIFAEPPASTWHVWPTWRLAAALGCTKYDRDKLAGFHKVNGLWVAARIKESMRLNRLLLFDRDMVDEMPEPLAEMRFEDWRRAVAAVWPGFDTCGLVRIPSTSSRIEVDGAARETSACHAIALVDDAEDITRAWAVATHRTLITEVEPTPWDEPVKLAFKKAVRERKNGTGAFLRWSWWTVFDLSTSTVGREVFDGAPRSDHPRVTILPGAVELHEGPALSTAVVKDPTLDEERAFAAAQTALTGVTPTYVRDTVIGRDGKKHFAGWAIRVADLDPALDIDLGDGWTTVHEWDESELTHTRCQTPFRDSDSMAGFLGRMGDGSPFLFDSGTGVTHTLVVESLTRARDIIREWFVETYQPVFFCKGDVPYCKVRGRLTGILPDDVILDRLVRAREAERDKNGVVIQRKIPTLFNSFIKAALGMLAKELPREGDDGAVTEMSAEETSVLITNLLAATTMDALPGFSGRWLSLGSWALTVAELGEGRWHRVGDLPLWAYLDNGRLSIGIKPELASRVKGHAEIAMLSPAMLTRRCKAAGIAQGGINENVIWIDGRTIRVTVLRPEFVAGLYCASGRRDLHSDELAQQKQKFTDGSSDPNGGGKLN